MIFDHPDFFVLEKRERERERRKREKKEREREREYRESAAVSSMPAKGSTARID